MTPKGEHDWVQRHITDLKSGSKELWFSCRLCGMIKRRDGKNAACRATPYTGLSVLRIGDNKLTSSEVLT